MTGSTQSALKHPDFGHRRVISSDFCTPIGPDPDKSSVFCTPIPVPDFVNPALNPGHGQANRRENQPKLLTIRHQSGGGLQNRGPVAGCSRWETLQVEGL